MEAFHILLFVLALAVWAALVLHLQREKKIARRIRLSRAQFPLAWEEIIYRNVPLYRYLPLSFKAELHGKINLFLDEKHFEGCGGICITDEIRVTVAASACLLLLNRPADCYPGLESILVYPSAFIAEARDSLCGHSIFSRGVMTGETWSLGCMVLAWDEILDSAVDFPDPHNLLFHEFAHQLDQEDGAFDGAPRLGYLSRYVSWAKVLSEEYEKLNCAAAAGKRTYLDEYGATSPAEFFSVLTEAYFGDPLGLRERHPRLYEELKGFYNVDPAEWIVAAD